MADLHDEEFLARAEQARNRIRELSPAQAAAWVDQGAVLVDVRGAEEFANDHLPGALHAPLVDAELAVAVAFPDFEQPIVCYCNGGNRGALAADRLVQQGYRNVASIAGGLRAVRAAASEAPVEAGCGSDAGAPLRARAD